MYVSYIRRLAEMTSNLSRICLCIWRSAGNLMQAGFGYEVLLQVNQAAMPHLRECCHSGDLVLASGTGRLGTHQWTWPDWPWWFPIIGFIYSLHPCHCGHFVHDSIGQWQGWLGKKANIYRTGHPIQLTFSPCLLRSSFEHLHGTHLHFSSFQRCVSFSLFHYQFSNHVPSKSLTIQPNHWPYPIISI